MKLYEPISAAYCMILNKHAKFNENTTIGGTITAINVKKSLLCYDTLPGFAQKCFI